MFERLDEVRSRIRDVLEFVDQDQCVGAFVPTCLDQTDSITDHGIEIDPPFAIELLRIRLRNLPHCFGEASCTGLIVKALGPFKKHVQVEMTGPDVLDADRD